ncbi:hypothetical protein Tco_0626040 [Tanacetum coccineum]|uniref:RNA-directed DNA polymerase, eukaryota n=1 Tax=Tanacetum coccineum TaxID=301880 RepID=A0ABQ4WIG3_9ASTR
MSKLDRFLVSNNLFTYCPHISAITLDRFLSDHQPILLRETSFDYGPIPFRFFQHWIEIDGFSKFIEDTWNLAPVVTPSNLSMQRNVEYPKALLIERQCTRSKRNDN